MDVLMPQLGETVAEGKLIKWFKAGGDAVAEGELLFEIETDKTSMEVPAMATGTLTEIRVQEGETVPVNAVVAVIAGEGQAATPPAPSAPSEPLPLPPPEPSPAAPVAAPEPAHTPPQSRELDPFNAVRTPERNFGPATLPDGVKVTPVARRLAAGHGLDLTQIKGSGPRGRISAADVNAAYLERVSPAVAGETAAPDRAPASAAAAPAAPTGLATGATADQVKALYADVPYREAPLDGMRRTIAKRLLEAKQTVPHFYLTRDVSLDALLALRTEINGKGQVKVTVNDFIVRAYALALQAVPAANAVWAEDRMLQFEHSDVAVAVSVEGGLITPVVRKVETKSLSSISAEIRDLAERARARKLQPSEYQGGAAAISNLGMYGVREFAAIINPPHATILAVGAGERRPVEADDGGVRFESRMTVTLSADHRVVDGVVGAQLLAAFAAVIENPLSALI